MNPSDQIDINNIKSYQMNEGPVTVAVLKNLLHDFSDSIMAKVDKRFDAIETRLMNLEIKVAKLESKQWFTMIIVGAIATYIAWKFILFPG